MIDTTRSTTIAAGDERVATVEHLCAALAGAGVRDGLVVELEGAETPLLDGGARAMIDAILGLAAEPGPPSLRVVRDDVLEIDGSRYTLSVDEGVHLSVDVDFGDPRLSRAARWDGDAGDFRDRIAPARTFGFAREVGDLLARGLASHVSPESVVVIDDDRILSAGAPFTPDEPARHKLLDLAGDLFVHGGPPEGRIHAARPGHAATHMMFELALARGSLALQK